jgi:hypothetical protein
MRSIIVPLELTVRHVPDAGLVDINAPSFGVSGKKVE